MILNLLTLFFYSHSIIFIFYSYFIKLILIILYYLIKNSYKACKSNYKACRLNNNKNFSTIKIL